MTCIEILRRTFGSDLIDEMLDNPRWWVTARRPGADGVFVVGLNLSDEFTYDTIISVTDNDLTPDDLGFNAEVVFEITTAS